MLDVFCKNTSSKVVQHKLTNIKLRLKFAATKDFRRHKLTGENQRKTTASCRFHAHMTKRSQLKEN